MNKDNFLIYGANGYTGELIAREAAKRGLKPTLGGRNKKALDQLGLELELNVKVFGLDDAKCIATNIKGFGLVLNCAGPFSATAAPMMEACIRSGVHYLDITGEISVFEHAQSLNKQAQANGVVLCPGVGFDVIPTDCIARALKEALPDATYLSLGFDTRSGFSPGTAKTTVEGFALGGKVRQNGKIITVPLAYRVRKIDFGDGIKDAMTIPWGDVSTAFASTGIPNIEVFIPATPSLIKGAKLGNWLKWLMTYKWVQNMLKNHIGKTVKGPSLAKRDSQPTFVWGEAKNSKGEIKTARIKTANGYSLTITSSLFVTDYVLTSNLAGGAYTPSRLVDSRLIERLPGSGGMRIN